MECFLVLWRTRIPWIHFEMLYIINFYRYLQIPRVFPRGSCYKSAKAIQSPHPRLKIIEQSWQIPRYARICPQGLPPPPALPMATDKCIIAQNALCLCTKLHTLPRTVSREIVYPVHLDDKNQALSSSQQAIQQRSVNTPPPAPLPSLPPVAAWKFSYRTTFPVSAYWLYRQYSSWNNVSRAIWEASIDRSVAKVAGKIIFRVKQQPNGFCVSHIAQYIARWRMRKLRLTLSFIQHSRIGLQSTAYIHT